MKITWLGHACFKIEKNGFEIVLDPYAPGSVPGYKDIRESADLVLCSHEHGDHCAKEEVELKKGKENPFTVSIIDSWHDDRQGALRGANRITVLDDGEIRAVHMGDIGCALNDRQLSALKGADVLMIPVGGHFTIDAAQAKAMADEIGAKVVIPMHYSGKGFGYPVIGPVENYTRLCRDVKVYDGSSLEVTPETVPQTAVLRPKNLRRV